MGEVLGTVIETTLDSAIFAHSANQVFVRSSDDFALTADGRVVYDHPGTIDSTSRNGFSLAAEDTLVWESGAAFSWESWRDLTIRATTIDIQSDLRIPIILEIPTPT